MLPARLIRRHPYHAALAALAAGLACCTAPVEAPLVGSGAAVLVLTAAGLPVHALVAALLVGTGWAVGAERARATEPVPLPATAETRLERRAILLEHPRRARFGSSAAIELIVQGNRRPRVLALAGRSARWPPGSAPGRELVVVGRLGPPRPSRHFDRLAHLRRRGIAGELTLERVTATGRRRAGAAGMMDRLRARAERAISAGQSPGHADLVRGLVLGQDEAIAPTVRDDFRRSGLAHLLAVSGHNVALLGALTLPLTSALGLGPRAGAAVLTALIGLYVPVAGAGPSLQRAAVMGAAALVALMAGRPSSRWYALGLAVVATLALDPRARGDPGWQLSFAAVAGILVLGPGLRSALGALPRPVADGAAITVAATVATAPLLAHHFGTVSVAGIAANLLALPVVAPIMWLGMVQAALGQAAIAPLGHAVDGVTGVLGRLNAVPLAYLAALAGRFATAPGAAVAVELPGTAAVAGAYAGLGALALAMRAGGRGLEPFLAQFSAGWRRQPRRRRIAAVAATLALLLAGGRWALAPPDPPKRLTVSFLDVGQGDATLVQHPDGSAVLFDAGPREARVTTLLRSAGVRRLSAVVATHASADHHGGLADVLAAVPVDLLVDGGDGTADPPFRALVAGAHRRGIRRVAARAGQTIAAGGLRIRVLSPPPRPPGPPPEDPNPRAVAAVVESGGFELFLAADAESGVLASLRLPDVDAMKVSHHGSADPGLPDLLRRLRPQVAAIEVGEDNGYGHPAPATLAALRAAVPHVHRTDQDGTVSVTVEGERMEVATGR